MDAKNLEAYFSRIGKQSADAVTVGDLVALAAYDPTKDVAPDAK